LFFCHRAILDFNVAMQVMTLTRITLQVMKLARIVIVMIIITKILVKKITNFIYIKIGAQGINFGVPQGFDLGLFFYLLVFKRISQKHYLFRRDFSSMNSILRFY
jgi:hypothetical protein